MKLPWRTPKPPEPEPPALSMTPETFTDASGMTWVSFLVRVRGRFIAHTQSVQADWLPVDIAGGETIDIDFMEELDDDDYETIAECVWAEVVLSGGRMGAKDMLAFGIHMVAWFNDAGYSVTKRVEP